MVPSTGVLVLFMGACFFHCCCWCGKGKHSLYTVPCSPVRDMAAGGSGPGVLDRELCGVHLLLV